MSPFSIQLFRYSEGDSGGGGGGRRTRPQPEVGKGWHAKRDRGLTSYS